MPKGFIFIIVILVVLWALGRKKKEGFDGDPHTSACYHHCLNARGDSEQHRALCATICSPGRNQCYDACVARYSRSPDAYRYCTQTCYAK